VLRWYSCVIAGCPVSLYGFTRILGSAWDAALFAGVVTVPALFIRLLFGSPSGIADKGVYLVASLVTLPVAISAAIFYGWAGVYFGAEQLGYTKDISHFWTSAAHLGGGAARVAIVTGILMSAVILAISPRPKIKMSWSASLCSVLIGLSLPGIIGAGLSPEKSNLSRNILLDMAIDWLHPPAPWIARPPDAKTLRTALVRSGSDFNFLSEKHPLVKSNRSFGLAHGRPVSWKAIEKPNVVIIMLESMRANEIGAYGSGLGVTPFFDSIAAKGWVWRNFYANGMLTWRAAIASLSSSYPPSWDLEQHPSHPVRGLAEILGEHGYDTEFWQSGSQSYGNHDTIFANLGYKKIVGADSSYFADIKIVGWGIPDHILMEAAAERLNAQPPQTPLHMLLLTVSGHHPYLNPLAAPDPLTRNKELGPERAYQEIVSYVDYSLSVLFKRLSQDVLSRTIFVILGDHGTDLGVGALDKSMYGEPIDLHYKVPLLVYAPALESTPKILDDVASQVDIMPTVLDLLGIQATNHSMGRSLIARSAPAEDYAYYGNTFWHALRSGNMVYMHRSSLYPNLARHDWPSRLYDLSSDPRQKKNLVDEMPALAESMHAKLQSVASANQALWDSAGSMSLWSDSADFLSSRPPTVEAEYLEK